MSPEVWAAIIGSLVLVGATGIGVVIWSHVTNAQGTADEAARRCHEIEVRFLEYKAEAERRFVSHDRLEAILENIFDQLRAIHSKLDNKVDKGAT